MIIPDKTNSLFQLAANLVNQSSRNIFLTGKAGTGKTTFLKYIRENCPKQMAVTAPTGVAAINAGGVTLHSFFQLPFSPFIPEANSFSDAQEDTIGTHGLLKRLRFTGEKIKLLQQLELLIIDEISMVRCDMLDAIDTILRHIRKKPADRFGGLQVLFIGDMFQLPPVIRDAEWKLLSDFYDGPYFFNSRVIREAPPVYIEFNKIYRQSEEKFIRLLNQVRNNELDEESAHILEERFQPDFHLHRGDGYIVLTTHNEKARETNARELQQLNNTETLYRADIQGEFPENAYPAEEFVQLKVGAQVMFLKNDSDKSKRYFNGKIGTITRLEEDKVYVQCKNEPFEIEVGRETWRNIRYTLNKKGKGIEEEELGSFTQFPLRLAWAITIHKSQGLTFEKAIIDAGEAFAAGQVYVALSRCTSLEGMILKSRINRSSLHNDRRIIDFAANCSSPGQLQDEFMFERKNYQLKLLIETFDFSPAVQEAKSLQAYLNEHESSFNEESKAWVQQVLDELLAIQATATKFHNWLEYQVNQPFLVEENNLLQTKTKDGAAHFIQKIQPLLELIYRSPVTTDSRQQASEINESIKEIAGELALKNYLLKETDNNLDPEAWHLKKNNFTLPAFSPNTYAGNAQPKKKSTYPQLYDQLRKLRDSICAKKDLPIYLVAGSKTLDEMTEYLPQTAEELEQITGFGKVKVERYGQEFLEIIVNFCRENNLSSRISEKIAEATPVTRKKAAKSNASSPKKPDTKAETFRLFREGHSISQIAEARKLAVQTIENHLAYHVEQGSIHIEELLDQQKISLIEPALQDYNGGNITPIKEKLGTLASFGEIRLMIAWKHFQAKSGVQS